MQNLSRVSRAVALIVPLIVSLGAGLRAMAVHAAGIEEKAQVCSACHGEKGVPIDASIPVIWGQNEGYIYLQLRDIKKGARTVEAMAPIVESLERADMLELAAYFATKPWPNLEQKAGSDDDARTALRNNSSIGCTGCHLGGFLAAGTVPRLAGQQHAYLEKTMEAFRNGARGNNPGMTALMQAADPADLPAIAAYLAGL